MSAIYGKFNFNQRHADADELYQIEKELNHWNADDKGFWNNGSIGLGHLMLYNTPESLNEKLPFSKSDNQLTITADARIDNREELFIKLNITKNDQRLIADSTLILYAYEKYGENCVKHLIGDFAFAIWDGNEQKLFCARDHMGIKPFFYYIDNYFFAFATEVRGLLAIDGINKEIDEVYFLKLIANYYPTKAESAYKHIRRLNCASVLVVKNSTLAISQYWSLDAKREIIYENEALYIENFRTIFKEAVKCRLRSNYLIGTELSGGLDSSGIACVASGLLHAENKKIASFTSIPAPKEAYKNYLEREEAYADESINFAAIDFVCKRINQELETDILKEIDSRISVYGYPCYSAVDWNKHFYKTAQTMEIRTILSGHGGDQLITDQNKSYLLQYIKDGKYSNYFKNAIKAWGFTQAIKNLITAYVKQPYPFLLTKMIEYHQTIRLKKAETNFLTPVYFSKLKANVKFKGFPQTFKEAQKMNIIDNVFVSDRMEFETINGLNYKICPVYPMQDIRLMEYVLALPTSQKIQPGKDRLLYRRAMQGLMPEKVANRNTKHISPALSPQIINWQNRQPLVKDWLGRLEKNKQIPAFINYTKLLLGYNWAQDDKLNFNKLLTANRKRIELVIRWFEKNATNTSYSGKAE